MIPSADKEFNAIKKYVLKKMGFTKDSEFRACAEGAIAWTVSKMTDDIQNMLKPCGDANMIKAKGSFKCPCCGKEFELFYKKDKKS